MKDWFLFRGVDWFGNDVVRR